MNKRYAYTINNEYRKKNKNKKRKAKKNDYDFDIKEKRLLNSFDLK